MSARKLRQWLILLLLLTIAIPCSGYAQATADTKQAVKAPLRDRAAIIKTRTNKTTQEQREAAADRLAAARQAFAQSQQPAPNIAVPPAPYDVPDYFGVANWANSPPLRKFIDPLPSLPLAVADSITYPGSDYYEISVRQYTQQLHADLPLTTLRGYVQTNKGTDGSGQNTINPPHIQYLGPLIIAQKNRPVRIKFTNELPTGADGNLFIPVDTTTMGAGAGPDGNPYPQNRAVLHLHGGKTPWISDGTPHQWICPAGEPGANNRGVSSVNVPDMPDPGEGSMTYYYSNQQSARLLWIHDHSWGITRLNVYVGEAMGYLLQDDMEKELLTAGLIPSEQIPLILQDKAFVDAATVRTTDPTWNWGTGTPVGTNRPPVDGDLWYPHVYVPAQNPYDVSGVNPYGRWPYGPWFWPPTIVPNMPIPNPYADQPGQPPEIPGTPHPSAPGESFMDTAIVNGAAFPVMTVEAKPYRLRILNAANDRFFNLQMYEADPAVTTSDGRTLTEVKMVPAVTTPGFPELWPTDGRDGGAPDPATAGPNWVVIGTEGGFLPEPVIVPNQPITWNNDPTTFNAGNVQDFSLLLGPAERADVIVDFSAYAGKTLILYNDAPAAFPALDARYDYYTGAPDMTDTGGHSGPLAGFGPNIRTVMQIKVNAGGGSPFNLTALQDAFKTTGTADGVFKKGQDPIIVGQTAYNAAYNKTFPATFPNWGISRIQDTTLKFQTLNNEILAIPMQPKAIQDEMGEAFDEYGRLNSKLGLEMSMTTAGIQTFVLQNFVDPATEIINDCVVTGIATAGDGTQIWKITHNGVDTHPVHFHLYDVQVINRVGWDGAIRLPHPTELGWKDTVRISPLEDTIIALRAVSPKQPFGVPDSVRPYNPQEPIGSTVGFTPTDPLTGQPRVTPVVNVLTNFGWEYVFHCHILSHEEMDMMRPVVFNVARELPDAPVLSAPQNTGTQVDLTWTDATPAAPAYGEPGSFWGNPQGEIGFKIERSSGGAFTQIGTALANATTYADTTASGSGSYTYRIKAYNAAGDSAPSNEESVTLSTASPGAPTGLTATAANSQQINLAWADNANNENGFRIERGTDGIIFAQLTTVPPGATAFSDTTVVPETTYFYRVFAYNDAGDSLPSNIATATTPPAPPTAPSGLTATAVSASRINLAWTDNANNETGFRIERAIGAGAFSLLTTAAANTTTYGDTTAAAATTYSYRIIAINAGGNSAPSNTATATTLPNPPAAPSNLTATAASTTRINLAWKDNANNETGFRVERAVGAGAFSLLATVGANVTTYGDTSAAAATSYSYRIIATNTGGNSAASNTATATTPAAIPAAPSNLTATAASATRINLAWKDNANNETGFRIERATGAGAFSLLATVGANITAYGDTSAAAATTYSYRIIATNAGGSSAASNTATATTPTAIPAAPSSLAAAVSPVGSAPLKVTVTWADNSINESGFYLQRATNTGFTTGLATFSVGPNVTTYVDTAVALNTTYYYRIRAYNGAGNSAFSSTATAITPRQIVPVAPTDLIITATARATLSMSWTDNAVNETGFYVERSTSGAGGPWTRIASLLPKFAAPPSIVTYINFFLAPNTTYWYRVQAYNIVGPSVYSNVVSGKTNP